MKIPSREAVIQERERLNKKSRFQKSFLKSSGVIVVVAAIAVLIATQFLPIIQIYGTSMDPVLADGDIVLSHKFGALKQGDIIAFYFNNKVLVKRVIAQGGDWIDIDEAGNVYVNNELLDEPYLIDKDYGENDLFYPYQVPEEQYFVMGDHRSVSIDSRSNSIGCVSKDQFIGHLAFIIWPFEEIRIVS